MRPETSTSRPKKWSRDHIGLETLTSLMSCNVDNRPVVRRRKMPTCCWDGRTSTPCRHRRCELQLERVRWRTRTEPSKWRRWASCQASRRWPSPCGNLLKTATVMCRWLHTVRAPLDFSKLPARHVSCSFYGSSCMTFNLPACPIIISVKTSFSDTSTVPL